MEQLKACLQNVQFAHIHPVESVLVLVHVECTGVSKRVPCYVQNRPLAAACK
jgi:hypothetical protein